MVTLKDKTRHQSVIVYRNGNPTPFNLVKNCTLAEVNALLRDVQRNYMGNYLQVGYYKGETGGKVSGCFSIEGVAEMLRASDNDRSDVVYYFMGIIVDLFCDIPEMAHVTRVFTMSVHFVHMLLRRGRSAC